MRVVVTGATGLIGRAATAALVERGDSVVALSRDSERARRTLGDAVEARAWFEPTRHPPPRDALDGADAVLNLLGEPIAQRWTHAAKREIRTSRELGTRNLVAGLRDIRPRPTVLVSQSAIGYYGPRGDERVTETDPPAPGDFLSEIVVAWEREANAVSELGMRVVTPRTGVVVSPEGGAVAQMLPFFRLGLGGPVAGGRQYVPWIHVDDVVGALLRCVDDAGLGGAVNVTAPEPVTNAELSRTLGRVLGRPAFLPVPALALRLLYGEMASILTTGVRAVPARLLESRYSFRQPDLRDALHSAIHGY